MTDQQFDISMEEALRSYQEKYSPAIDLEGISARPAPTSENSDLLPSLIGGMTFAEVVKLE